MYVLCSFGTRNTWSQRYEYKQVNGPLVIFFLNGKQRNTGDC